MEKFLAQYWDEIVELFEKIYNYIKEWLIENDEAEA